MESTPLAIQGDDEIVAKVVVKTQDVRNQFKALQAKFAEEQRNLPESGKGHNQDWPAFEEVLAIPFIPVAQRLKLLENFRKLSYQLNQDVAARDVDIKEDQNLEKAARRRAFRQGRMLLAILGKRTFEANNARDVNLLPLDQVEGILKVLLNAEKWWERLAETSSQVARRGASWPTTSTARLRWAGKSATWTRPRMP